MAWQDEGLRDVTKRPDHATRAMINRSGKKQQYQAPLSEQEGGIGCLSAIVPVRTLALPSARA